MVFFTLAGPVVLAGCGTEAGMSGGGSGEGLLGGGGGNTALFCNDKNEDCNDKTCRGDGANMLPGSDCLVCHERGGPSDATAYQFGGTVYSDDLGTDGLEGVIVRVTDTRGEVLEMKSSRVGNFYSRSDLQPPMYVEVERDGWITEMVDPIETGDCNSCHACDGETVKLYAP
ncbi:MAG: hypothetical protein GY913_07325 [Proteobacteria bacterium]|nr:hypothetical protein [Pseudomonadota bacterium]MCP4916720.1 hypothetical protein [Pseudomonadota bacterium]